MKIKIKVQNINTGISWWEDYDQVSIDDVFQAKNWATSLIERFNEGCRKGESQRALLEVELVGASTEHDWYKHTAGMSMEFRGRCVDTFECRICGVTGKRLRLGGSIVRDSKYKAKKYAVCGEHV